MLKTSKAPQLQAEGPKPRPLAVSMTAYRFCRTDDIALLVEALNRCWSPYFPGDPPMTPAAFKRSIRDLQVWCSSCMVAFSGSDPIGVLIGAKRSSATLVHRIAVQPDHRRQGHGRHLLASLGSKLAILGPPRIVAEVPRTFAAACELFAASGYVQETLLTDYLLPPDESDPYDPAGVSHPPAPGLRRGVDEGVRAEADDHDGRFVIPVTVDDLAANGLLGDADVRVCWDRSVETLTARKDELAGFAVASDERIEAYLLYAKPDAVPDGSADAADRAAEIVSLRTFVEDGGARLKQLLSRVRAQGMRTFRMPKVHPAEISKELLETIGFRPAAGHLLYSARARSG